MDYISLPFFYENFKINNIIYKKSKYKQNILNFPFKIFANYGSLPYSLWNGLGVNNNQNILLYKDIISLPNNLYNSVILNCSNLYITEQDYHNRYMNMILENFNIGSNFIEISSLKLYEFLENKNNYYNYIFSDNADLIFPINEEILKILFEKDNIKYFILPQRFYNNIDFLKNNKFKDKTIIRISKCHECDKYSECLLNDNQNQYNYSKTSNLNSCKEKMINYEKYFFNKKIFFNNLGYHHFIIDFPPSFIINQKEYINLLLKILIKEENQHELLKEYYND